MKYNAQSGNILGVNIETSAIYFGTIPHGGTGTRKVFIETQKPLFLTIKATGSGKEFISFSNNRFIVQNQTDISISFNMPKNPEKEYNGTILFIFRDSF